MTRPESVVEGSGAISPDGEHTDPMGVFGETLRQARAFKGVSLKEAEQATRINRQHLAALEDENFAALPPLIYQRGIVRNYATYLELDPIKILAMFEETHGGGESPAGVVVAMKPLDMPSSFTPNFAVIAFLVVLSAILFAWLYSVYRGAPDVMPTSTAAVTVTPLPPRDQTTPIAPTMTATATAQPEDADEDEDAADSAATASADTDPSQRVSANNIRRTQVAEEGQTTSFGADATIDSQPSASVVIQPPTATPTNTATPNAAATRTAEAKEATAAAAATATRVAYEEGLLTISITPRGWIWLTVQDSYGAVLFDGQVGPGVQVGPFNAESYTIYTSEISVTWITNHDSGREFLMPGQGGGPISLP